MRRARPFELAGRGQRRRADQPQGPRLVHRQVRPVRVPAVCVLPGIRAGRVHSDRVVQPGGRRARWSCIWTPSRSRSIGSSRRARAQVPIRAVVGCGRLFPTTRMLIVDPDTRKRCAPDEVGEIWIDDPAVTLGLLGAPRRDPADVSRTDRRLRRRPVPAQWRPGIPQK